ncbi:hypothetical protein [Acetobacter sp.]|uniref:hypothetical protein n=1 Tax=Acetobacter sp. TaxID=440 RepID=UPI0025BA0D98|nr:hypothetical protein [Acetobacter sp.]MCH4090295.1 hypothetical protein [Acetobacter sp.]MCI1298989.1 hypothetical protein [Acetobacter sp.]MCI1315009.1 hypothetical protein [Acetobacter sp.]
MAFASYYLPRLLIASLLAYPAGLVVATFLPHLLHMARPDSFCVAQMGAIIVVPTTVLTIFGTRSLWVGLLAAVAVISATMLIALPLAAFGPQ